MTLLAGTVDARWISAVTGGRLSGNANARIFRGWADSRLCQSGDLFVAVKGENVDGNRFVASAWENGAEIALVSEDADVPEPVAGKALVRVPDVLVALQEVAREIRKNHSKLKVVGITGSNGKTTTKEVLAAIVREQWGDAALVTRGNYNSDIGLPLMLLELEDHHEVAVLEMGMNRHGEIAELASIARPEIAVITNIGTAHIGLLGSQANIAAEKRHILDGADSDSVAVVGADETWADYLLESYPGNVRCFGLSDEKGWELSADLGLDGYELKWHGRKVYLNLPGMHNLMNAMAAVETALALGAAEGAIIRGIESVKASGGRSEIRYGAVTVINDGYNANPESLNAAFNMFKNAETSGRRVLVLGEMLELGDATEKALIAAGGAAANLRPDGIFLFGASLQLLEKAVTKAGYSGFVRVYTEMVKLQKALAEYLQPGDLVLLKGSRASALERLDNVLAKVGTG